MVRAALVIASLAALAGCSAADERAPATDDELAAFVLTALAVQDAAKIERYSAPELVVDHSTQVSSLGELLEYIDENNCSATETFDPQLVDSKIEPGTQRHLGVLICGEKGTLGFGGMNIEMAISDMQISYVNWYFLMIGGQG